MRESEGRKMKRLRMAGAAARKLEAGNLTKQNHTILIPPPPTRAASNGENLPLGRNSGDELTKKRKSLVIEVSKKRRAKR
jgi:hypothetical protein